MPEQKANRQRKWLFAGGRLPQQLTFSAGILRCDLAVYRFRRIPARTGLRKVGYGARSPNLRRVPTLYTVNCMQGLTQSYKTPLSRLISLGHNLRAVFNRTYGRVERDDCLDIAAQVSFFFVLSMFPFFLVIAAILGLLPTTQFWAPFVEWVFTYFPRLARSILFDAVMGLSKWHTGVLSFGIITAIWSASSGFVSLMEALSVAYGARDTRGYWKKRAIAVATTLCSAVFVLFSFGLWALGHWAHGTVENVYRWFAIFESPWKIAWWLFTLFLLCIGIDLINYFLPDCPRPWRWFSPGTLFVAFGFALASVGLNFYVRHNTTFPHIYGTLGGFIVFMLWIYMAVVVLLIGAETDTAMAEMRGGRS
jgi:membrane protein